MRRALPFAIVGLIALAFVGGHVVREGLGLEFSPLSIQSWVEGLGWKAPAIFVLLITFRQFLLLPSMIILPVGGLCFGVALGTILGAAGILISGMMQFSLARGIARDWLQRRLGESLRRFSRRLERAGPMLVAFMTAHPTGPMSLFHWGSGFATIGVLPFLVALVSGGLVRAFAYSYFGSSLLDPTSPRFLAASVLLAAAALVPFAHPGLRRILLGALEESDRDATEHALSR